MRLSRIELYLVSIPLTAHQGFVSARESFRPNWIPGFHQQDVKFYLLRLMTDDGIDGVAAVPAMGMERAGLGQLLGSYLLGMNPLDTRLINQRDDELSFHLQELAIAEHTVGAQRRCQPLARRGNHAEQHQNRQTARPCRACRTSATCAELSRARDARPAGGSVRFEAGAE
jgi:hypothetical protein